MSEYFTYTPTIKYQGLLLTNPQKAVEIMDKEFRAAMEKSLMELQREVVLATPINVGTLRASITSEISGRALDLEGRVGSPLQYAEPVEYGQDPHWPNIDAIAKSAHFKYGGLASYREEIQRAFLIARSIARKGVRAFRMFGKAFEKLSPKVRGYFDDAGERAAKKLRE